MKLRRLFALSQTALGRSQNWENFVRKFAVFLSCFCLVSGSASAEVIGGMKLNTDAEKACYHELIAKGLSHDSAIMGAIEFAGRDPNGEMTQMHYDVGKIIEHGGSYNGLTVEDCMKLIPKK